MSKRLAREKMTFPAGFEKSLKLGGTVPQKFIRALILPRACRFITPRKIQSTSRYENRNPALSHRRIDFQVPRAGSADATRRSGSDHEIAGSDRSENSHFHGTDHDQCWRLVLPNTKSYSGWWERNRDHCFQCYLGPEWVYHIIHSRSSTRNRHFHPSLSKWHCDPQWNHPRQCGSVWVNLFGSRISQWNHHAF